MMTLAPLQLEGRGIRIEPATSLRTIMRLPAPQRSTVILKDVLGHSLDEIASITGDARI